MERTANLLGAASLALTDLSLSAATQARRLSTSSAAALVSLAAHPGLSVSELGRRVKLSQPAAARMVDSLETAGLVAKVPSSVNRRWVTVRPTRLGSALARQLLTGRNTPLVGVVSKLDESDQQTLAGLLEKLLAHVYAEVGEGQRICRLCDRKSCTRSAPCPVGECERAEET
ncbi:MarR family winged helix-turn-helix transcriptional regulator [Georgenia deserti]|uniref:MarR family winged helix-turn-helix transcriptional regulator n=1 Tax=Georgenia deserti TaxID=2093781 RepID=A0ABW4L6T7_9MICO